ncbi:hypothetical protein ACFSHQ_11670 [Gemmobacter lanyuensis]
MSRVQKAMTIDRGFRLALRHPHRTATPEQAAICWIEPLPGIHPAGAAMRHGAMEHYG